MQFDIEFRKRLNAVNEGIMPAARYLLKSKHSMVQLSFVEQSTEDLGHVTKGSGGR